MSPLTRSARHGVSAVVFLALALCISAKTPAVELAPAPRAVLAPTALDRAIITEIKTHSEIMKNLQYLSDMIGARLTGSRNLERANTWTAETMKSYGLENVRLEPWEIPVGWERGPATMKIIEPDTGRSLMIASAGWMPGTNGKVTGDVIILKGRTKADLAKYKGKLKGAVILASAPVTVAPITDLRYLGGSSPPKNDEPKKKESKKDEERGSTKDEQPPAQPKKEEQPKKDGQPPRRPGFPGGFGIDLDFLKAEGAACLVSDAGKPHSLLVTTGGWPADRAAAEARLPRVFMAHEHYALLYRLASREGAVTRVETQIANKFIPGPITVYNTIGEVRGSEKPEEVVIVGAHLDSWDLAQGTTDNGTGSCVVLETARTIAALAREGHRPKRTIRFCLYTGEEQGLWGSRKYVERHKAELDKHSAALVHDTGTGRVLGFGVLGRESCKSILDTELAGLKELDGWQGLTMGGLRGGTDHWSYHQAGVPGFAVNQENDEYRLTHHTQSDTFDKAKEPNLIQGAQVMAVTAMRIANLPDLLPRK
jgi:carboxypeptidase Q